MKNHSLNVDAIINYALQLSKIMTDKVSNFLKYHKLNFNFRKFINLKYTNGVCSEFVRGLFGVCSGVCSGGSGEGRWTW